MRLYRANNPAITPDDAITALKEFPEAYEGGITSSTMIRLAVTNPDVYPKTAEFIGRCGYNNRARCLKNALDKAVNYEAGNDDAEIFTREGIQTYTKQLRKGVKKRHAKHKPAPDRPGIFIFYCLRKP